MSKTKKILIAVVAVILVVALVLGGGFLILSKNIPEKERVHSSQFYNKQSYSVATSSYEEKGGYDTSYGLSQYWSHNKVGGYGMDIPLQCTKDDQIVVLCETLPGFSNAEKLYGKKVAVSDLTLEEVQDINPLYNFKDEDGKYPYRNADRESLNAFKIPTLDEYLENFISPIYMNALLFVHYDGQSKNKDSIAVAKELYGLLKDKDLLTNVVFRTDDNSVAKYIDDNCNGMLRTATPSEMSSLYTKCLFNKKVEVPYSIVIAKAGSRYASAKFLRCTSNMGIAVILEGVKTDDVLKYREMGAKGFYTDNVARVNKIIYDAQTEERLARLAEKKSAAASTTAKSDK